MIRIVVLLFLILSSFKIEEPNKTKSMYFMIGKESKEISYREYMSSMFKKLIKLYEFKNGPNTDDPLHVYIFMTGDKLDPFDTIVKPRRFLDSIQYYDENWLINEKDLATAIGSYRIDTKYYVIDTSAMHNDTIKLYRCDINVEERY